MKRRWRLLLGLGAIVGTAVLVPIGGIELGCRAQPVPPAAVTSDVPPAIRRPAR